MKKSLLLGLTAVACFSSAIAQSVSRPDPKIYDDASFQRISADGKLVISEFYGSMTIYNLETGEKEEFLKDDYGTVSYTLGLGNCLTSDGKIILANYPDDTYASYYEGGEWHNLNVLNDEFNNPTNGITPDGKRICGNVGMHAISLDEENIMQLPAYWDRNEDGTYGECKVLPHPTKDFFGESPQYVTAISISSDGKTILGQMVFGSGMMTVPVIYQEDEKGEWTYSCPTKDLFNPGEIPAVENPGECPAQPDPTDYLTLAELEEYDAAMQQYHDNVQNLKYPDPLDFMTEEEKEEYKAALEKYNENWAENPYPNKEDFMTEEELAKYKEYLKEYKELTKYPDYTDYMSESEKSEYESAMEAYQTEYANWEENYYAFSDYQLEVITSSPNFLFNNVLISTDDKKYVATLTSEVENDDPSAWMPTKTLYTPCTIDIATGELQKVDTEISCSVSGVADNGIILASEPTYTSNMMGYVIKDGSIQTIIDYIGSVVPEYKNWIKENMSREIVVGMDDDYEEIYEEVTFGGMPIATPDMGVVATWVIYPDTYEIQGVIYDLRQSSAVSIINTTSKLSVGANGSVVVPEGFVTLDIYSLNGTCVKSVSEPRGVISLGLPAGVYVAKGTRADGTTSIVKVGSN